MFGERYIGLVIRCWDAKLDVFYCFLFANVPDVGELIRWGVNMAGRKEKADIDMNGIVLESASLFGRHRPLHNPLL